MGRLQHIERLALGRSAFQPGSSQDDANPEGSQPQSSQVTGNDAPKVSELTAPHLQQYDSKGRPSNPATDAQNARLRHASNEVLALVGVVERKDSADARVHLELTHQRSLREHLLIREDNRGNEWGALIDVVSWFAMWWPTALVRRIHIGIYSTRMPFSDILRCEASMMFGKGWRGLLLGLLPGVGISILHKVLWQVLALIVEESVGAMQNRIVASNMRRRNAKRLLRTLTIFIDVALVTIDVLLLPLETYALARQLNISPPTPWRELLSTQFPSFFRTAYRTTFASPASLLTSAAPFLVIYSVLTRDPSPEAPAFSDLTAYRVPSISTHVDLSPESPRSIFRDPLAFILHGTWSLRQSFLRFVGWDMYELHQPGATHGWETDVHYEEHDATYDLAVKHRSTSLARLPATWLGMRVDMFLVKILLLPVEGMVMRRVAEFYMSSDMPLTGAAMNAGPSRIMPRVWSLLEGAGGWDVLAREASQVGLAMAVNLGVEAVFFACVYAIVRQQGIAGFGWVQRRIESELERPEDVEAAS